MGRALYRKYRSKSLDTIVGQSHITDILSRAIKQGKIAHAYLLTGPRGVGKTSIARILAHEINQLPYTEEDSHLDIIEIDAASNNGVDDVRELRERVQIAPVSASKKVYIIDEVHMLTKPAFNALLKTLEEPPEHVVFILATTDVDKLPATIVSRVEHYTFRAITPGDATHHLRHIADQESISITDEALALIALHGDGSFRDSISLLDQLVHIVENGQEITAEHVERSLGLPTNDIVAQLIRGYEMGDIALLAQTLTNQEQTGIDASVLAAQTIRYIRKDIMHNPHHLDLIERLMDVQKSTHPYVKLLTVLASAVKPKEMQSRIPAAPAVASVAVNSTTVQAPKSAPATLPKKPVAEKPTPAPKPEPKPEPKPAKPTAPSKAHPEKVDWNAVLAHVKTHSIGTYTILSKSGHEIKGDEIVIYCGKPFAVKKIDTPKGQQALADALQATGAGDMSVKLLGSPSPLKDSQAAAIADIMGGGEEVSVNGE